MASISIPRSTAMSLERLSSLASALGPPVVANLKALFKFAPTLAKYVLWLVILVNMRSWPLAWHFRVFRPVFRIRLAHKMVVLRSMFKSGATKIQAEDEWLDSICPVGSDPLKYVIKYNSWASLDESDFNGHLSNSSYAKTMDAARFKSALAMFPRFFGAGGWIALAATHYNFIREIPMLASYEVRLTVGTWDHKWLYVIAKFVSKPSKKSKKPQHAAIEQSTPSSDENTALFNASLRTPADEISSTTTPLSISETPTDTEADAATPDADTAKALKAVAASLASEAEPDGAILHTISVSQCCFKIGRITVPPALVLAINGFSVPGTDVAAPYSPSNPPPHWPQAKKVMSKPAGGNIKKLQTLLRGGWREVPEKERWWDAAMGGAVEERRKKGLEVVRALGMGIAGVRHL
ncbi:hypothetical protein FPV67DRAFT_1513845 [Lyophyllum atratum]|nr:hypothetical protein FPV67DRAFT_1513845 [Lyophyllum atratum]